ncbi:MAG: hypothetical protein ACYC62_05905, partial [Coriobacteriia bacterium]
MKHISAPERLIVLGRAAACALLAVVWTFGALKTGGLPPAALIGGAIYLLMTLAWVVWARVRPGTNVTRMLG